MSDSQHFADNHAVNPRDEFYIVGGIANHNGECIGGGVLASARTLVDALALHRQAIRARCLSPRIVRAEEVWR